ncbi:hypothetical protein PV325_003657 [Microctonus aethiopoides]|nr:hypothetical protein PV325_003657 [Microctonus aethiopoides]
MLKEGGLKWHTRKFVTSYLQPVVRVPPLLHIALREIFCLCVVKVEIFLTSEANQQNYSGMGLKRHM